MQKKALFMGQINSTLGTKKAAVPNASTFHCKRKSTALFLKAEINKCILSRTILPQVSSGGAVMGQFTTELF